MVVKEMIWPNGKQAAFCLAVDDVRPEGSKDEEGLDFGGDMDQGNFRFLNQLVEQYPYLKMTLFVPVDCTEKSVHSNWKTLSKLDSIVTPLARLSPSLAKSTKSVVVKKRSYPRGTFRLTNLRHQTWCKWLSSKVESGNFEVAPHGLNHDAGFSSMEFVGLSEDETLSRLLEMEYVFDNSMIPYVKGFRPPGWGANEHLPKVLGNLGYKFYAAYHSFDLSWSEGSKVSEFGFVSFCANCNMSNSPQRTLEMISSGDLVLFQTHIMTTCFGVEHVSNRFVKVLSRLLDEIELRYHDDVWFATLGEISDWVLHNEDFGDRVCA